MLTNGRTDRQTDDPTAVTLAAHVCRGFKDGHSSGKAALFGLDILERCTPLGTGKLPALPVEELMKLKQIMLHYFPQYWQNVAECGKNARQHLNTAAPAQSPELHVGDVAPDMDAHVHHVHVYTCHKIKYMHLV